MLKRQPVNLEQKNIPCMALLLGLCCTLAGDGLQFQLSFVLLPFSITAPKRVQAAENGDPNGKRDPALHQRNPQMPEPPLTLEISQRNGLLGCLLVGGPCEDREGAPSL